MVFNFYIDVVRETSRQPRFVRNRFSNELSQFFELNQSCSVGTRTSDLLGISVGKLDAINDYRKVKSTIAHANVCNQAQARIWPRSDNKTILAFLYFYRTRGRRTAFDDLEKLKQQRGNNNDSETRVNRTFSRLTPNRQLQCFKLQTDFTNVSYFQNAGNVNFRNVYIFVRLYHQPTWIYTQIVGFHLCFTRSVQNTYIFK